MPRTRALPRLAATSALTAAAFLIGLLLAAPAHADGEVEVDLRAPNSSTPGRMSDLRVNLKNRTRSEIAPVRIVFVVRGVPFDSVQMTQGGQPLLRSGGDGDVVFAASLQERLAPEGNNGDSLSRNFSIVFSPGTPSGPVDLAAQAYLGDRRLGEDSKRIRVRGSGRGPQPTTPPNTDPGVIPTFEAGPTVSVAPLEQGSPLDDIDPGIPPILYVMGAVLLAVGGVLLWLLYRQRGADGTVGTAAPGRTLRMPGMRGVPRHSAAAPRPATHHPTRVLPPVQPEQRTQGTRPAWSGRTGRPDTTPGPTPGPSRTGGQEPLTPPSDPWATGTRRPIDPGFDPFAEP